MLAQAAGTTTWTFDYDAVYLLTGITGGTGGAVTVASEGNGNVRSWRLWPLRRECEHMLSAGLSALVLEAAAQLRNVALWRGAEELLVVAAEVRRVFVAHAMARARRVKVLAEHQ